MPIILATQTLIAFERAVAHDGGNTFRMWQGRVMPHMRDAYRADEAPFRTHMGASGIGNDCARAVWYGFRWTTMPKHEGRMLRLWNRGHLEEGRMIALLLTIGCNVIQQDEQGRQFKISELGGHYGGSGDGMADGIPDIPQGTRALTEYKTHNDKSFKKLAGSNWDEFMDALLNPQRPKVTFTGDGLRVAKPEHYVQMQQYMRKMGLAVGVYFAINKNDDYIYAEVVPLDVENADAYTDRAIRIVPMHTPPDRINKSPSWFKCKFCDHRMVCHYGQPPARNCRTCEHSHPEPDGSWRCTNETVVAQLQGQGDGKGYPLNKAEQLAGCDLYRKSKAF